MIILHTIKETRDFLAKQRKSGKSIGLVPTMGALHQGHISLTNKSVTENDLTISSIYVNPVQFNNPEDFKNYPIMLESDAQMLEAAGCNAIFAPSHEEMYPNGFENLFTSMEFDSLSSTLEGEQRPGHFSGVGVVVSKLFNIVAPNRAYFGQKDMQQLAIISQMNTDLSFGIEIVRCPTVREKDGLAMSSRNRRLNPKERAAAPTLYQSMLKACEHIANGGDVIEAKEIGKKQILEEKLFGLEYFEFVHTDSLEKLKEKITLDKMAICLAAQLGSARLIDNFWLKDYLIRK
ncbi:pantoate--beta-alanine ligase [Flammeovirgaceae bacterium SG7u.111]|nr:pantoate--beta-alanine ligase [Flammeovirgaceae bacterium SG7u.132]WPO37118.1 pantoate--beta-alanine ligase [Flammeovirgaceae bacterium SG7u.111]